MKTITLITFLTYTLFSFSQSHTPFHIGHSLMSERVPAMVQTLADSTPGLTHSYNFGLINGAPLFWHWDHSATCTGYQASTIDSKVELASGNYDVFIMTEGVPWHTIMNEFYAYTDSFQTVALNGNPNMQTYLYETFNCINTGTPTGCMYDDGDTIIWEDRISADITAWENVADSLIIKHPGAPEVFIIPVGQAFVRLKDSVDNGNVPGVNDVFTDLFIDDIHPNDTGYYFASLVHYACIYGMSPVGLPAQTISQWGGLYNAPDQALALKLQEIAWATVCEYPRSGVNCSGTTGIEEKSTNEIKVYPNPTEQFLTVTSPNKIERVLIYDVQGRPVNNYELQYNGIKAHLDLCNIQNGTYFVEVINEAGTNRMKFILN